MQAATRPNIIVICSDQHRADTMGCYGSRICRTPALDRLASQGVRFDRCYATNPVCSPSRATILTGCGTRRHGLWRNGYALRTDIPTLAQVLKRSGYQTAAVGKLHITQHGHGVPRAPFYGFDRLDASEDPKIGPFLDWVLKEYPQYEGYFLGTLFNLPTNEDYWKGRRDLRKESLAAREKCVKPLEISPTCNWGYGHYSPIPEEAHQTTWITNRSIAAIEERDPSQPLLLWVGYQDPHNPFDPPGRFRDLYAPAQVPAPVGIDADESRLPPHLNALRAVYRTFTESDWRALTALYYGSITFMDEAIGRLLAAAERCLDMRNTIVVYIADHGEILGDHGVCGKWAFHFDSAIRVPLLARWDGHWPAGLRRRDAIVELTDLAPTLIEAAGAQNEAPMDGRSLAPLLAGSGPDACRDCALIESYNGEPGDPTPPPRCWPRTIRSRRWRATFYPQSDFGELYDLENDPAELNNLWRDPRRRRVIAKHRALLLDRILTADFPLPPRPYAV